MNISISIDITQYINKFTIIYKEKMSESAENDKSSDKCATAESGDLELEGKNKTQVLCQNEDCKSVVLQPGIASRVKKEVCYLCIIIAPFHGICCIHD
jgi:hypothetical protein